MGSRTQQAASDRVYEDFVPFYEWDRNERLVNVMLPGFRRDQLKVQVTSKPTLRLMGERLVTENRWRRFNLELPLLSDYDTDSVTAKFEGAKLSIKFGELSLSKPKETLITPPSQKIEQQKAPAQEGKAEEAKTNGEVSDQKTPQNKEETNKTETTDGTDKGAQEAKTNGLNETKEAPTPTTPKTRPVSRSKTRLIDFSLGSGSNHVDDEVNEDLEAGKNKCKRLVKWMVIIYLAVALVGLGVHYGKNALTSYPEESYFQEL